MFGLCNESGQFETSIYTLPGYLAQSIYTTLHDHRVPLLPSQRIPMTTHDTEHIIVKSIEGLLRKNPYTILQKGDWYPIYRILSEKGYITRIRQFTRLIRQHFAHQVPVPTEKLLYKISADFLATATYPEWRQPTDTNNETWTRWMKIAKMLNERV